MIKTISLRDANQRFAKIIREVEETGETYQVLRRGEPVARITPEPGAARKRTPEQEAAWQRLLKIMRGGWKSDGPYGPRDELYDD